MNNNELKKVKTRGKASFIGKMKNRRVSIWVVEQDGMEGHGFLVITKILRGRWQDRRIIESDGVYSFGTMAAIHELYNAIINRSETRNLFLDEMAVLRGESMNVKVGIPRNLK